MMVRCLFLIALLFGVFPVRAQKPETDPFAADARMQRRYAVRVKEMPIRDLLADLTVQTGVRFFADPAVINDRVTLLTRERPLAETLRAVAIFFGFEWAREGGPDDFGYVLRQRAATRQEEEAQRQTHLAAYADLVVQEVSAFQQVSLLTEKQRSERESDLERQLMEEKDRTRLCALRVEYAVLRNLEKQNEWERLVYRFLRLLPREEVLRLFQTDRTEYAWPEIVGAESFPTELLEEIRQNALNLNAPVVIPPGEAVRSVHLRFEARLGRIPRLAWNIVVRRRMVNSYAPFSATGVLPSPAVLLAAHPEIPTSVAPSRWKEDESLLSKTSLKVGKEIEEEAAEGKARKRRTSTLGDALLQLAAQQPVDIIADAFWSTPFSGIELQDMPLGEVLTHLANDTAHRWWKQDGFVVLKSQSYALERWAEPPSLEVARWRERADRAMLDLDDCAEIAALPDQQLETLLQACARGLLPSAFTTVNQARSHLALWNALTRAQRRKASAEGIEYAAMTPTQQQIFARTFLDAVSMYYTFSSIRTNLNRLMERSRLRVEIRENRLWGIKKERGSHLINAGTQEEAFRLFQTNDPTIQLRDIKSVVNVTVQFIYDTDRGQMPLGACSLPIRWEN